MGGSLLDKVKGIWRRFQHPFRILEEGLPELERPPDQRDLRELHRVYIRLTERGERAITVRIAVVGLLSLSVISGAVSGYLKTYGLTEVEAVLNLVLRVSTALGVVLVATAVVLNRYINNLQNRVLLLGMQIAATHRERSQGEPAMEQPVVAEGSR